jgi:MoxR-like ATPase
MQQTLPILLDGIGVKTLIRVATDLSGGSLGFDPFGQKERAGEDRGKKGNLVPWIIRGWPEQAIRDAVARVTGTAVTESVTDTVVLSGTMIETPITKTPDPEPAQQWKEAPADTAAEAHRILGLPFNQIHGAIESLITRANRPPEIIERVVEVPIPVPIERVIDRVVYADRAAKVDAATGRLSPQSLGLRPCAEVFGIAVPQPNGSDTMVEVFDCPTDAPDQHYRFSVATLRLFLSAMKRGRWAWLYGPPGTGKTEFLRNVAARLGRPFYRVNFDGALERYELIGGERLRNGSTEWLEGVLTQALTTPHAIVDLDEVSFGRPEHLSALHGVLEPSGAMTIPETGRVIARAPGCYIAATDNTNGCGDLSGAFAGTRPMNRAFVNRFGSFIEFGYLDATAEAALIVDRTGAPPMVAAAVAHFAARARVAVGAGDLPEAPSLRLTVPLTETLLDGVDLTEAFSAVVANRMDPASAEALRQILNATVDATALRVALA